MNVRRVVLAALLLPLTVLSQRGSEGSQQEKRYLEIIKRYFSPSERAYCMDPNREFDTDIGVSFSGTSDLLSSSDYMELEDSF